MNLREILSYVLRDTASLRIAAAVLAGITTLAFATMVTILSFAFSMSVNTLLDAAITPTAPVASILQVTPRKLGGRFSKEQLDSVLDRIEKLKAIARQPAASMVKPFFQRLSNRFLRGFSPATADEALKPEIASVSKVVTAFSDDVFRFLDHAEADLSTNHNVKVWSMPNDSPFLARRRQFEYVSGGPFVDKAQPVPHATEARPSGTPTKPFRPKLGVIVNEEYYRHYLNLEDSEDWERRHENHNFGLPKHILLGFHRNSLYSEGRPPHIHLPVTGVVNLNRGFFPDLIFTEDLARAFYFSSLKTDVFDKTTVMGKFPGKFAHRFDQWETGKPLEPAPAQEPDGYFPDEMAGLDYVGLRAIGETPYDLLILDISNWQDEGVLTWARNFLNAMTPRVQLSAESAGRIAHFATTMAGRHTRSRPEEASAHPDLDVGNARRGLRAALIEEMAAVDSGFEISARLTVLDVGRPDTFDVTDSETSEVVRIKLGSGTDPSFLLTRPPWQAGEALDLTLRRTLIRLKAIIDTYRSVLLIVVLVLAVSTSLLMAFNHVFQKRRDIGLLLTNGATPVAVMSIYLAQMVLLATVGVVVGVALSYLAGPLIEQQAGQTLRYFLELARAKAAFDFDTLLNPNGTAIRHAVLWIISAALVGALHPVARATRVAPHETIARGGL